MDAMKDARKPDWSWIAAAALLVILVALALRLGTNVLGGGATFDEPFIRGPIEDILQQGWSVQTAIDFEETKGPAFIWTYAAAAEVLGGELDDFRLTSVLFFIVAVVPLMGLCVQCGLRGWALPAVAGLYILLPYHAPLAQLLMSESSFVFGALLLMWIFAWGFGDKAARERRVIGPVLFGLVLAILVHHRIHAVALAGAACLVAFERDRTKSWPWWLACIIAGLSRIPLWLRWGGLVSPKYQTMYSLGISPEALTYLAAALAPLTAVFILPVLMDREYRSRQWLLWTGLVIGLALALLAPFSLADTVPRFGDDRPRFMGIVASALRRTTEFDAVRRVLLTLLATIGMASLGALAAVAWRAAVTDRAALLRRLVLWSLLIGWAMTVMTHSAVYDRYLLAWATLLPIVWVIALPRWLTALQALMLLAICGWLTRAWLI
jgi:hypothetical protein